MPAWRNIPDPTDAAAPDGRRCDIGVAADRIAHVIDKHVRNDEEPWATWLGVNPAAATETAVGTAIESGVRSALSEPTALLYCVYAGLEQFRWQTWQLPLTSGATAIVRSADPRNADAHPAFKTCYFTHANNRNLRVCNLRLAVKVALLEEYAEYDRTTGGWTLPAAEHTVVRDSDGMTENRREVRFVSPASWGFAPRGSRWVCERPTGDVPRHARMLRLRPKNKVTS